MTAITLSKLCSVTSLKNRNSLYSAFTKRPSRCPNSRLIVANIVSRSVRLLTSARTARLPAPSVSLAACSDPSFKPQRATRAPFLSNSCAAASPIPLLPPVIRIFLSASLPMVVPPMMFSHLISFGGSNSGQHCPVIADPLVEAACRAAKYIPDGGGWGVHFSIPDAIHVVAQHGLHEREGHAHGQNPLFRGVLPGVLLARWLPATL